MIHQGVGLGGSPCMIAKHAWNEQRLLLMLNHFWLNASLQCLLVIWRQPTLLKTWRKPGRWEFMLSRCNDYERAKWSRWTGMVQHWKTVSYLWHFFISGTLVMQSHLPSDHACDAVHDVLMPRVLCYMNVLLNFIQQDITITTWCIHRFIGQLVTLPNINNNMSLCQQHENESKFTLLTLLKQCSMVSITSRILYKRI